MDTLTVHGIEEHEIEPLVKVLWRVVRLLSEVGLELVFLSSASYGPQSTHSNGVETLWVRDGLVVVCPLLLVRELAENITHAAAAATLSSCNTKTVKHEIEREVRE